MAWEQLLVLLFFFVLPVLQALSRKRAKREQTAAESDALSLPELESEWERELAPVQPVYMPPTLPERPLPVPAARPQLPVEPRVLRPVPLRDPRATSAREGLRARGIRTLLRQPHGIRRAVLINAVLDKPLSLRRPE